MEKLRFTHYAWAKLRYLRDKGKTEVGFMAVTHREAPNLVVDVRMPKQMCSWAFVEFKEEFLHEFFERMVDDGYEVDEFARIWCHTHPGASASPSNTDEETFKKEFGSANWSIMFILGTTDQTTCRIKYKNHPELVSVLGTHASREIAVVVDYDADTWGVDDIARAEWDEEYAENWSEKTYTTNYTTSGPYGSYKAHLGPANSTSTAPKPTKYWRDAADDHVYGPGWRYTATGWEFDSKRKEEDIKNEITVSPDWNEYKLKKDTSPKIGEPRLTSQDFRDRFNSDDEKGKRAIGFQQSGTQSATPQTTHNGRLTKREKKYLRKHKTLEGFIPPVNKGYKESQKKSGGFIPASRLETSRNLLNDPEWDNYIQATAPTSTAQGLTLDEYNVTLDDGTVLENVWAYSGADALKRVYERMDISPTSQVATKLDTEFDFTEPTDKELMAIEKEEKKDEEIDLTILPLEDEGEDTVLEIVPFKDEEAPAKLLEDMTTDEVEALSDEEWQAAVDIQMAVNEGLKLYKEECEKTAKEDVDALLGDQFPEYPLLEHYESNGFDVLG